MTDARQESGNLRRIGRLIIDGDLSDDDATALTFALQRDTRFVSQRQTANRIDVFEVVE